MEQRRSGDGDGRLCYNITVIDRNRLNLRVPKNRVIYFLRTAGHYLTEKSIPASVSERCGLDGFKVVSMQQLTAVLTIHSHTPGPRSLSGVLKIADKRFDRNRRSGRGRTSRKDFVDRLNAGRRWPGGRVRIICIPQ